MSRSILLKKNVGNVCLEIKQNKFEKDKWINKNKNEINKKWNLKNEN